MEEKTFIKRLEERQKRNELLNEQIKELLLYVGFVGAIVSGFAYILITIVMITGLKTDFSVSQQIIFSLLGAFDGLMISFLLRSQGVSFAKREEKSQKIIKEYNEAYNRDKTDTKKAHDITWYMVRSTIIDIFIKGLAFAITTYYALFVAIEGNGDWALIGLAIANVLFFISFGLVGLAKAYDFFKEEHLAVLKERTKRFENKTIKEESCKIKIEPKEDKEKDTE